MVDNYKQQDSLVNAEALDHCLRAYWWSEIGGNEFFCYQGWLYDRTALELEAEARGLRLVLISGGMD